jgi:hypothetical protein
MSQIGHHLVFTLAKLNAKNIISQHLKSNIIDELVEKIPNSTNIHWEEMNAEFELSGQMYDVIKKEVTSTQTYYYCINDQKESGLLKIYSNWIKSDKSSDQQKQNAKTILKYTQIECDFPIQKLQLNKSYFIANKMITASSHTIYRSLVVEGPPPKHLA